MKRKKTKPLTTEKNNTNKIIKDLKEKLLCFPEENLLISRISLSLTMGFLFHEHRVVSVFRLKIFW